MCIQIPLRIISFCLLFFFTLCTYLLPDKHLILQVDAEHPLYSADKSGKLSPKPFIFDPENWIYRAEKLKDDPRNYDCKISVLYVSDQKYRLVKKNVSKNDRLLAKDDFYMFLEQGLNPIASSDFHKVANRSNCTEGDFFELKGLRQILKAIKTDKKKLMSPWRNSYLDSDLILYLPMRKFAFKEPALGPLAEWMSFSDPNTLQPLQHLLESQIASEPLFITNIKTIGLAQSSMVESFAGWKHRLNQFCSQGGFVRGGPETEFN